MEDDWASPWADADDRSPTKVIKNFDSEEAEDAGRAGIDAPVPRIPGNNAGVHMNDPWAGGEHGLGDASAWASPSPTSSSGKIPEVVGGSRLPEWTETVPVEVPPFAVKKVTKEETKFPVSNGDFAQQNDRIHNTSIPPVATAEADVWAAGSNWGEVKTEIEEFSLDRELPADITVDFKPPPDLDNLVGDIDAERPIYTEENRGCYFTGTEIRDPKPEESALETGAEEESLALEIAPTEEASISGTVPTSGQTATQGYEFEGNVGVTDAESKDEEDDDFGDFADEGDFEETGQVFQKDITPIVEAISPLPSTLVLKVDTPFSIDTSLLKKLYPIPTSYPEPPPIKELICTTESRKAWYRLSQSGTIRKDKSGDDNYVRVTWGGSKVQEGVNRIVARWMAEDRNSGGGLGLGGSRRLGAMFGWGEGVESVENETPVQLNLAKDSYPTSSSTSVLGFGGDSKQSGTSKLPLVISTTKTYATESGINSSPKVASFGWSSLDNSQSTVESHPTSSLTSVKGEEKPPSTPYKASFYSTRSSQSATPSKSVTSHSPIGSSHSNKHNLAVTRPSSPSPQDIPGPTKEAEAVTITLALMDNLFSAAPATPKPADRSATTPEPVVTSVISQNFDEWGTFENMATTVKLPSTAEANCNFDEWGAFEELARVHSKPNSTASVQDQPPKSPKTEESAISSNTENWSAFGEPLATQKTATFERSSQKSPKPTPATLEQQRSSGEQKVESRRSMVVFTDPLAPKPPPQRDLSVQQSTSTFIESESGSAEGTGLKAQKTDDRGSSDPLSALPTTNAPKDSNPKPIEVVGSRVQDVDNWGSFEVFESALTPKSTISNQQLVKPPAYTLQESNSIGMHIPTTQKIDNWGSFDTSDAPQSKTTSGLNLSTPAILNSTRSKHTIRPIIPPTQSSLAANDDDDDWGEMVQSPEIRDAGSSFSTVLQPTTLSQNTTPRTMSPAPLQSKQLQPQELKPNTASTASMFDFSSFEKSAASQKPDNVLRNGNGNNDTWDLSFFDSPVPSTPTNASALPSTNQVSHDLWDAPPPTVTGRRENAKEMEESRAVNQIVEGLPDLSYMLS